jgi:hypothetical protein
MIPVRKVLKGRKEGRKEGGREGGREGETNCGFRFSYWYQDVMPCIMVKADVYQSFIGTCCLHLQDHMVSQHRRQ